jgi:uncharacterized protein YutE (UPF0331/DUF86 family)
MVNADLVAAKLVELAERVGRARKHCPQRAEELAADRDALDLVAFNMMLAVQVCADVASHIIADEGWAAATTMAAAFGRLGDHGVLDAQLALRLGRAVGLRNVVADDYAGIDPAMLHDAAQRGVVDLDAFARAVAAWLSTHGDTAA